MLVSDQGGVMLGELQAEVPMQTDLFAPALLRNSHLEQKDKLLATMSRLNREMGRETLWTAS